MSEKRDYAAEGWGIEDCYADAMQMSEKKPKCRQCISFERCGPFGMGECKTTGYVFSGAHEVDQCAMFSKKVRRRKSEQSK